MLMPLCWRTWKKRSIIGNPKQSVTKVSLPQEGDASKFVANADKHVAASNVVNKVIEVVIGEDQSLGNVDVKWTFEIKMLHEEVVEGQMVEERLKMLEDNVVMVIN